MADVERGAPPPRSRAQQSGRDLVLSILPLVLIVLAVVGFAGMCSFSPGGPTGEVRIVPPVDAPQRIERLAESVEFPVRSPRLPPAWVATSADTAEGDAFRALRVGWLTPGGNYLRLSQSAAGEPQLAAFETGRRAAPTGAVQVAGRTWVRYPAVRAEEAWIADLGDVRLLITGSGTEREFRTLASAALDAPVLPR